MSKTFKTVTFGGFDKNEVQSYIAEKDNTFKKQIDEKENTIQAYQNQINQLKQDLQEQIQQNNLLLAKKEDEIKELKEMLLVSEDKINKLEKQLSAMEEYVKKTQQQTRNILEESNKKCTLKLQQMEKENEEKIEAARLNAIALFDKINQDYQTKRNNYAELTKAIHRLNLLIKQADEEAEKQISSLPASLL